MKSYKLGAGAQVPTPPPGDNSGKVATTAFVETAVATLEGGLDPVSITAAAHAATDAAGRANAAAGANQVAVDAASTATGAAAAAAAAAQSVRNAYRRTPNRVLMGINPLQLVRDAAKRVLYGVTVDSRLFHVVGGAPETVISRAEVAAATANTKDKRLVNAPIRYIQGIATGLVLRNPKTKGVAAFFTPEGQLYESAGGGKFQRPGRQLAGVADRTCVHDPVTGCSIEVSCTTRLAWFLEWGQSPDQSGNADNNPTVYTPTPRHPENVFMLSPGMNPNGRATTGLVPAVDQAWISAGETNLLSLINRLWEKVYAATGVKPLMGGSIQARGGTSIANLRRGTDAYQEILTNVVNARDYAKARGWEFYVAGMRTMHGNEDAGLRTTREAYARAMEQLQYDLDRDIRALTGQVDPVQVWWSQTDTGSNKFALEIGAQLAPLDVARRHPHIHLLTAHYDIPRDQANSGHFSALGQSYVGERDAETMFADYYGNGRRPFAPVATWIAPPVVTPTGTTPATINVEFYVPVEPLVVDTSNALIQTAGLDFGHPANGLGFEFDDGSVNPDGSSAAPYVTGVTIAEDGRTAQVALSAMPTGPRPRLVYAMRRSGPDGPVTGSRGCLRDSSPAVSTLIVDPVTGTVAAGAAGSPRPLYNWAVPFSQNL